MTINTIRNYMAAAIAACWLPVAPDLLAADAGYESSITTRASAMRIQRPGLNKVTEKSRVVYFGDLDLEKTAGVQTLYKRLTVASKIVCSPRPSMRELANYRDWKNCSWNALDSAVSQVGVERMSQLHLAESGRWAAPDEQPVVAQR